MNCLICHQSISETAVSNFCRIHQPGWVVSKERKTVDWLSDESYKQQSDNYAAKVLAGPEEVEEDELPVSQDV